MTATRPCNDKKHIVVCDIDGTIAHSEKRYEMLKQGDVDWDKFYDDCFDDEPITEICDLVNHLSTRYCIIFLTSRRECVREKTTKWLCRHIPNISEPLLLMRDDNDTRSDMEVKSDKLFSRLGEDAFSEIAFFLEDRNAMVQKWRELGFRCLQVAEGEF